MSTSMITLSQRRTFQFVQEFIAANGYSPTMAEIAKGIGIKSKGVAHRYVKALVGANMIKIVPNRHRNIQLLEAENESAMVLPIVGRIAAGQPIEAVQEVQTFNVVENLLGPNRYILKVKGDSMIGDNICDGDFIICEHREAATNGEIAVVLVDNHEATLKRMQNNGDDTVTLLPSNPSLSPMVYEKNRVNIQGIYLGLLRFDSV